MNLKMLRRSWCQIVLVNCISGWIALNSQIAVAEQVLAEIDGEKITYAQAEKSIQQDLYKAKKAVYDLYFSQLKSILVPKLIRKDPRSSGLSDSDYIFKYIVTNQEVTTQEVQAFIKERGIAKEKINPTVINQIKEYIENTRIANALDKWFWQQAEKHQVKINLTPPTEHRAQIDISGSPFRGPKNAPVTIIEFSDFECPYCEKADATLRQLLKKYPDSIKVVYKHYPLDFHKNAQIAAEAGVCAAEQSNQYFWQLHDQMFSQRRNLSLGVIKDSAKSIGLNYQEFNTCLASTRPAKKVAQDMRQGAQVGVTSTPVFFINGKLLQGAQPLGVFVDKIEAELSAKPKN
ncbi:DsbA family protein [Aliikangiella sp. IMCC44632]